MGGITEISQWENEVYRIELDDPVEGGESGIDNKPHKHLANRTKWLKQQVEGEAITRAGVDSALAGQIAQETLNRQNADNGKANLGGSNSQRFKVADAVDNDEAVSKSQLNSAVSGIPPADLSGKANLGGSNSQRFKVANAVNSDEAVSKSQLDSAISGIPSTDLSGKANLAGSPTQTFNVATATDNNHAVNKAQLDAIIDASAANNFMNFPSWLNNNQLKWGVVTETLAAGEGQITATFPTPFPNQCFIAIPVLLNAGAHMGYDVWPQLVSFNENQAVFYVQASDAQSSRAITLYWAAIGR